ncbi:MAG TPA: hypothetical protein VGI40_15990 [Pirellulaceae bacterium]|jgi:hypothetical protein
MNDELQLSDEQVRLATSRAVPGEASFDGETAAARDGFLSLGAAVEAAAGNFDEAALLARLQKSCVTAPVVVLRRRESARDWMSVVLAGALAAAGMIAIVRIATDPGTTGSQVAQLEKRVPPAGVEPVEAFPSRSMFAWNDPLDDEIALASATIEQFTSRGRGFDGSLLDMNDQLKALSQELTNETL